MKKKRLNSTVNFGEEGDPARILVEAFIKKNGKRKLSPLIRKLIVFGLSKKKEYNDFKVEMLKQKRKEIQKRFYETNEELLKNEDQLKKHGIDVDKLWKHL